MMDGTIPLIFRGFILYAMFLFCALGTLGVLALVVTLWRFYLQVRLKEGQELRRVMGTLGGKSQVSMDDLATAFQQRGR